MKQWMDSLNQTKNHERENFEKQQKDTENSGKNELFKIKNMKME